MLTLFRRPVLLHWLGIYVLLNATDWGLTALALHAGALEVNPVALSALSVHGLAGLIAIKLLGGATVVVALSLGCAISPTGRLSVWALRAAVLGYVCLILWDLWQLSLILA